MFSTLSSRLIPSLPRNGPKILSSHRSITFNVNTDLNNRTEDFVNARPLEEIPKILSLPLINSLWIYYPVIAIALVALDARLGCMKDGLPEDSEQMQLVNAMKTSFEAGNEMIFGNQFWKYFPTSSWRRFSAAVDNFRSISKKHLREIKKGLLKKEDRELTLMETLLVAENMSESEAIATIVDMISAGIDTTATTLGFNLYFFARNPDVQEKAYQEVITFLPSPQDSVTSAILEELRYLKACLKESMRMAPIITFNQRTLKQDAVFSGFIVPAGTVLQANTLTAGWLEENFPDPKVFKPERWLKENRGGIPPFSYIPFGFGPRMCVGKRIAEQEMWTFLAKVLRRYRLEYHYEDIGLTTLFVHVPDKPLRIKFIPREQSNMSANSRIIP